VLSDFSPVPEPACRPLQLERVLRDSKMDKGSVHDVVLVGGSTRIPKVQPAAAACIISSIQ
jgi:molecular chaperone DnaK (HSP70)